MATRSKRLAQAFKNYAEGGHVILPVIHVNSLEQALRNTEIAVNCKCDGVFLINHSIKYTRLLEIHSEVKAKFPDFWIGVNCLDLFPGIVFKTVSKQVDGVWVDNAEINEFSADQIVANSIQRLQKESNFNGLYFGGVAFKCQPKVEEQNLESAVKYAAPFLDVITSSGPGTGMAMHIQKPQQMRTASIKYAPNTPIAIASGITPLNVHEYLENADVFLVATGISKSFEELEPSLVADLVLRVRNFSRAK